MPNIPVLPQRYFQVWLAQQLHPTLVFSFLQFGVQYIESHIGNIEIDGARHHLSLIILSVPGDPCCSFLLRQIIVHFLARSVVHEELNRPDESWTFPLIGCFIKSIEGMELIIDTIIVGREYIGKFKIRAVVVANASVRALSFPERSTADIL
jgi:hypothetical protein